MCRSTKAMQTKWKTMKIIIIEIKKKNKWRKRGGQINIEKNHMGPITQT